MHTILYFLTLLACVGCAKFKCGKYSTAWACVCSLNSTVGIIDADCTANAGLSILPVDSFASRVKAALRTIDMEGTVYCRESGGGFYEGIRVKCGETVTAESNEVQEERRITTTVKNDDGENDDDEKYGVATLSLISLLLLAVIVSAIVIGAMVRGVSTCKSKLGFLLLHSCFLIPLCTHYVT